jgi:sigma-E factor negative regulatory protein RseA
MEKQMTTNSESDVSPEAARELLSSLADGELTAGSVTLACGHWRISAESQSAWHAYQLIGDVLRSDDLASDPASDARFLTDFRARLASEPVVLAPQALDVVAATRMSGHSVASNVRSGIRTWGHPWAIAAGMAAVAGALVFTRAPSTPLSTDTISAADASRMTPASSDAPRATLATIQTDATPLAREPEVFVANGKLIRDARLDRYLAAHKQFAGSSALGVPSVFLRNATADAGER